MLEGLWQATGTNAVKVFPEGLVAKDDLSQHLLAEIQILDRRSRAKRRSAGTEFESIHEYRSGDDPRRIDWRATARTRRLVIRRFQVEQHQDVLILIDCGRLMGAAAGRGTKLDCAVDSALLLARVALANGDRCGTALFDNKVQGYLAPRSSMSTFHTVVESLYDVQTRWQETDFAPMFAHLQARRQKRAVIIVLSDVGDEETSRRASVALSSLAARHVVIFAAPPNAAAPRPDACPDHRPAGRGSTGGRLSALTRTGANAASPASAQRPGPRRVAQRIDDSSDQPLSGSALQRMIDTDRHRSFSSFQKKPNAT